MVNIDNILALFFIISVPSIIIAILLYIVHFIYYLKLLNHIRKKDNHKFYEISGLDKFSLTSFTNDKFWKYVNSATDNKDQQIREYKKKIKLLSKVIMFLLAIFFIFFMMAFAIIMYLNLTA